MLLTQSQVSVYVSSAVVIFFTLLLFLSGYVIQQRTVTALQAEIKPRIPRPPPQAVATNHNEARSLDVPTSRFFHKDGSRIAYLDLARARKASNEVNWQKLAHVQLVRNHHDVCNAIMVLADLHRLKSPARRLLLFPQTWATEKAPAKGTPSDPYMDSTRRLMRLAARRYGVELHPVAPWSQNTKGEGSQDSLTVPIGETYSLASAFALTEFDRILSIETPGLLQDATPLDAVLAFTEHAPFAMLHDTTEGDGVHGDDLFLIQPSKNVYMELSKLATEIPSFNDSSLPSAFPAHLLLDSSSDSSALIRSIGLLHQQDSEVDFNRTAFVSNVSYLRFSDPKLPGPEYDVAWSEKVAARPKNKDAEWVWTDLYGSYAQKRMEICGLDLETWRP